MKADLDRLMEERGFDAFTVSGTPKMSRDLFYLTGPVAISRSRLLKKRGAQPVLVVSGMERDEAAKSGLEIKTYGDLDITRIFREAKDPLEAGVKAFLHACDVFAISGTVAFYGTGDIPYWHAFLKEIEKSGAVGVHVEAFNSAFSEARMTKDNEEIDRIDSVSRLAQEVIGAVRDFLTCCSEKGGKIVDPDGREVKIGRVKKMIKQETEARGMVLDEEVIFSQGRDSAVPHSHGDDEATLVPGKTIVFDYCPQEAGGGFFADITRTWCLGHVPDEVKGIYDQVLEIQAEALDAMEVGGLCSSYDKLVNEYFDRKGHPTPMNEKSKTEGYVHTLGHGMGLEVHERPRMSAFSKTEEHLAPGHVFTVEPGLYYPAREIGVRIEDDIAIREDGEIVDLTSFPKDILVPLRGAP
jgi:Xaa-Pro aminopeptidase